MRFRRKTQEVVEVTTSGAELLAELLREGQGVGAGATHRGASVVVVIPESAYATTVWLPDELINAYIWGDQFQHQAPPDWPLPELAALIVRTMTQDTRETA